jgi:hypothetical protein
MATLSYWDAMAWWRLHFHQGVLYTVKADVPEPSGAPHPMSARRPIPIPWDPSPIPWLVELLVSAVSARQLAATMPDGPARTQLQSSATAAIAQILDDYCGTSPRLVPWPWPGPPPWVYEVASELTAIANAMQGDMREALLEVAGQVVSGAMGRGTSSQ